MDLWRLLLDPIATVSSDAQRRRARIIAGLCLPFRWYVTLAGLNAAVLLWLLAANPEIPPAQGIEFWGLVLLVSFVTGIHALVQMRNERELERAEELALLHGQLLAAQEQLVQAAKLAALGELAAGVAHELNNPLTATLGYASLLESKLQDTDFPRAAAVSSSRW